MRFLDEWTKRKHFVVQVYHDRATNMWYDECGQRIEDIYWYVDPIDMYFYRDCQDYMLVDHAQNKEILVEIIPSDLDEIGMGSHLMDVYDTYAEQQMLYYERKNHYDRN